MRRCQGSFDGLGSFEDELLDLHQLEHDRFDLFSRPTVAPSQHPAQFGQRRYRDEARFFGCQFFLEQPSRALGLDRIVTNDVPDEYIGIDRDHETERLKSSTTAAPIASSISSIVNGGPSYLTMP